MLMEPLVNVPPTGPIIPSDFGSVGAGSRLVPCDGQIIPRPESDGVRQNDTRLAADLHIQARAVKIYSEFVAGRSRRSSLAKQITLGRRGTGQGAKEQAHRALVVASPAADHVAPRQTVGAVVKNKRAIRLVEKVCGEGAGRGHRGRGRDHQSGAAVGARIGQTGCVGSRIGAVELEPGVWVLALNLRFINALWTLGNLGFNLFATSQLSPAHRHPCPKCLSRCGCEVLIGVGQSVVVVGILHRAELEDR